MGPVGGDVDAHGLEPGAANPDSAWNPLLQPLRPPGRPSVSVKEEPERCRIRGREIASSGPRRVRLPSPNPREGEEEDGEKNQTPAEPHDAEEPLRGRSAGLEGILQLDADDPAHTGLLHGDPVDPVRSLDGSGIVGNDDELGLAFELLQ